MDYESPIKIVMCQIQLEFENQLESAICKAVQNAGITVDREELLRALEYDRGQYQEGYSDGYADRDKEIIRCRDCARSIPPCDCWDRRCELFGVVGENHFCGFAKPKGENDE